MDYTYVNYKVQGNLQVVQGNEPGFKFTGIVVNKTLTEMEINFLFGATRLFNLQEFLHLHYSHAMMQIVYSIISYSLLRRFHPSMVLHIFIHANVARSSTQEDVVSKASYA